MRDYDCEILHHLVKANVVADALSQRAISTPIQDVCLRMNMMTPVLETIKEA